MVIVGTAVPTKLVGTVYFDKSCHFPPLLPATPHNLQFHTDLNMKKIEVRYEKIFNGTVIEQKQILQRFKEN